MAQQTDIKQPLLRLRLAACVQPTPHACSPPSIAVLQVTLFDSATPGGRATLRVAVRISRSATSADMRRELSSLLRSMGNPLARNEVLHIGYISKSRQ